MQAESTTVQFIKDRRLVQLTGDGLKLEGCTTCGSREPRKKYWRQRRYQGFKKTATQTKSPDVLLGIIRAFGLTWWSVAEVLSSRDLGYEPPDDVPAMSAASAASTLNTALPFSATSIAVGNCTCGGACHDWSGAATELRGQDRRYCGHCICCCQLERCEQLCDQRWQAGRGASCL